MKIGNEDDKSSNTFFYSHDHRDDSFFTAHISKEVENNFLVQLTCQKNKLIMFFLCLCKQMAKKRKIFGENI